MLENKSICSNIDSKRFIPLLIGLLAYSRCRLDEKRLTHLINIYQKENKKKEFSKTELVEQLKFDEQIKLFSVHYEQFIISIFSEYCLIYFICTLYNNNYATSSSCNEKLKVNDFTTAVKLRFFLFFFKSFVVI